MQGNEDVDENGVIQQSAGHGALAGPERRVHELAHRLDVMRGPPPELELEPLCEDLAYVEAEQG